MELLVLGVLIGAGAARRKSVTKAMAKGYLAMAETSSHLRQDLNDAILEARADQAREAAAIELEAIDSQCDVMLDQNEMNADYVVSTPTLTVVENIITGGDPNNLDMEATCADLDAECTQAGQRASVQLMKGVAKGFMKIADITRNAATHVREDMRDAMEEARYEREQSASKKENTLADELDLLDFTVIIEPEVLVPVFVEAVPIAIEIPVVVKPKRVRSVKVAASENGNSPAKPAKKAPVRVPVNGAADGAASSMPPVATALDSDPDFIPPNH